MTGPRPARAPRWLGVLTVTLRLGLTSFGGPIAHIGYQRRTFVDRLGWLDESAFGELVALGQALPGPASSQVTIAVGRLRAGWAGALAAWIGFTLPSAVLMTALGLVVAGGSIPDTGPVAGAIAGLKAAAVAIVLQAVVTMARRLTPDLPRALLAVATGVVALALPVPLVQPLLIVAGGIVGWLGMRRLAMTVEPGSAGPDEPGPAEPERGEPVASERPAPSGRRGGPWPAAGLGGRRTALALLGAWTVLLVGSQLVAGLSGRPELGFAAAIVRAGSLVFGGGHVVLPLLDTGVVDPGWVGGDAFLAGYGAAQALPGPLFSFAAYLGAVSASGPGGVPGALVGLAAIFLPGALLVLAALPAIGWLRARSGMAAALAGVNAAVVGILAAALVNPVATGGLTSPAAVAVAAAGSVALLSGRVPPILVVLPSAAAMAILA